MRVEVPGPLRSYTGGRARVQANGDTLRELFADLERRFPGMLFRMLDEQTRIRPHMRVFVDQDVATDIDVSITGAQSVMIVAALSGG